MFRNEKGFSTPIALIVIFSLCLMTVSVILLVYTNEKKINSYKRQILAQKKAEKLLQSISKEIQLLKEEENDSLDSNSIQNILLKYKQNNISLTDVSTGINKEFLNNEILENNDVMQYLFTNDAQISDYGWINPRYAEHSKIEQIEKDFGDTSPYPIFNEFPAYNLFEMKTDFLATIISLNKINEAEDKAEKIKNLYPEDLNIEKLSEVLGVQRNHAIFDFLGTKTVFWNVSFETDECKANAIFAILPQKDEQRKIEEYILVEHHITYKGGIL